MKSMTMFTQDNWQLLEDLAGKKSSGSIEGDIIVNGQAKDNFFNRFVGNFWSGRKTKNFQTSCVEMIFVF